MRDVAFKPATLREQTRREIAEQMQEFLHKGGKIQQVGTIVEKPRPIGAVWQFNNSSLT